jgi:hypothetical protein
MKMKIRGPTQVKSNNSEQNNPLNSKDQALQKKTEEQSVPAQKDGFRYDYNDSSDFTNDKMS